jgi:hypothetical protein
MQEWKLRQKIYHATNPITDMLDDVVAHEGRKVIETEFESDRAQVDSIKTYFTGVVHDLVYPTKSYVVALVYATLLNKHFGIDVKQALDDPELLCGNDKWFVPYSDSKSVYDTALAELAPILQKISEDELSTIPSQIQATVGYFNDEFLIGQPF